MDSEKALLVESPLAQPSSPDVAYPGRARRRAFRWLTLSALGGLALIYYGHGLTDSALDVVPSVPNMGCAGMDKAGENPARVWKTIKPSSDLVWKPCYENKECAKLAVPLDYSDPKGAQAAIALIKVASKIPPGKKGYRGPILFNPGGPGGSGVNYILRKGDQFRAILGDDYDLIGFDPRGIGFTSPKLTVFPNPAEKAAWDLRHEYDAPLNSTPDALARQVASWSVFGDLAKNRVGEAAQYVSTAFVARDMLRITEAHGFSKLSYWGFSYGSVLGITFASMFPDKVERLIVDGVCDTYNYYETQWSNNLRDTDAGLDMFYDACAASDPKTCALHESTGAAVKARTEAIFAQLKARPIAILPLRSSVNSNSTADGPGADTDQDISDAGKLQYGIVDYASARHLVFQFLYKPYADGQGVGNTNATSLAHALAAVEHGDGRPLFELAQALNGKEFRCECDKEKEPETTAIDGRETTLAIACSDGDVVEDSVEELQKHYEGMAEMSSLAEFWGVRVQCSGWKVRSKERFRGPFVGNTSFPIMLIGNTADPVTPLWNAKKMAKGFKDAAVLTQKSAGHCSLSAASLCTAKAVRNYFRHGVLPKPGTECEIEAGIFGKPTKDGREEVDVAEALSAEDQELMRAMEELSRDFDPPKFYM